MGISTTNGQFATGIGYMRFTALCTLRLPRGLRALHNSNWPTTVYSFKEVAFNYPYGISGRKILKEILHDRHFNCKIHILTGLKSNREYRATMAEENLIGC